MAILNGLFATDQTWFVDPDQSANVVSSRSYSGGNGLEGYVVASPLVAIETATPYPGPVSTETNAGAAARTFMDDWYYRIHIIPGNIDLGNLVSDQGRDVYLWNAYFNSTNFEAFAAEGADGVTVVQPGGIAPPYTLAPLELVRYETTVFVSGPPNIDTEITWTIDGEQFSLTIIGRRVIAFPFPPNWNYSVNETLEFKSTVIPSHDGSVQTANIRPKARRIFDFTISIYGNDAQRADSLLFGWQHRFYAMPVWPEKSSLLSVATAGDTVVSFATAYRSFSVGTLVILYDGPTRYEVREIAAIDGNTVTFASPLEFTWPTGTRVFPAFVASINPGITGTWRTDRVLEMPVRFTAEPTNTPANIAGAASATYQGYELVFDRPNWVGGLTQVWSSDADVIDLGGPRFGLRGRSGFSTITKSHNWTKRGYQQVAEFRGFLSRRAGMGVPFYMPSGTDDFTLVVDALASDTAIEVRANQYEDQVAAHPARRDIIILFRDGTYIARRIGSAAKSIAGNTRLVFDSALGRDFTASEIKRISYLSRYRFASNQITLNWLTRDVVTADATLVNERT